MEQLFTYELSCYPQAISNSDDSLAKTNKAQTLHDLEAETDSLDPEVFMRDIHKETTAVFIDHMACVQKLSSRAGMNTFGNLLDGLTSYVQAAFKEGDVIHVVSDKYDSTFSIKSGERKDEEILLGHLKS